MKDKRLIIMVSASLGLHAAAALVLLLLMRPPAAMPDGPEKSAEIELVMEEHRGDLRPPSGPPPAETKQPANQSPPSANPAKEEKSEQKQQADPAVDAEPEKPVETREKAKESVAANPPASRESPAQVEQPPAVPALVMSLAGTDSPSDARAFGDHIIPAAPDAVFHNRPPDYPEASARAGERGVVVLILHVAPSGQVAGVDVARSSGYPRLDLAARDAVMRWRFLPAVKGGQAVGSDMPIQFNFDPN